MADHIDRFAPLLTDEGLYDGYLVRSLADQCNWTSSTVDGSIDVTIADFREDTEFRIRDYLEQEGVAVGQTTQQLVPWLSNQMLSAYGKLMHALRIATAKDATESLRLLLSALKTQKALVLTDEDDPLQSHYKKRYGHIRSKECDMHYFPANKPADIAVAKHLLGSSGSVEHTMDALHAAVPFLLQIDDTHIEQPLLALRMELFSMLRQDPELHPHTRTAMQEAIVSDWERVHFSDAGAAQLSQIEEEVQAETGAENVLDTTDPSIIIEQCFIAPLSTIPEGTPVTEGEIRDKILRRLPILFYFGYQAVEANEMSVDGKVAEAIRLMQSRLQTSIKELGHASLYMGALGDPDSQEFMSTIC